MNHVVLVATTSLRVVFERNLRLSGLSGVFISRFQRGEEEVLQDCLVIDAFFGGGEFVAFLEQARAPFADRIDCRE